MPTKHQLVNAEMQERISTAAKELAGAEQALLTALESLPSALRSEKRIVSATLLEALEKVAAAKGRLQEALAEPDEPPG
jgi:hypothetical protein